MISSAPVVDVGAVSSQQSISVPHANTTSTASVALTGAPEETPVHNVIDDRDLTPSSPDSLSRGEP